MIRPLKRRAPGAYTSADGRWVFVRDENGYQPTDADRDGGCRSVAPGRMWDIGRVEADGTVTIVDRANTLREATRERSAK